MITFTYYEINIAFHFSREWGSILKFEIWPPCIMIYFTYRNLKVTTNEMTYFNMDRFSTLKSNPIYTDLYYFSWFKS